MAEPPSSVREAKKYVGRSVKKSFVSEGKGHKRRLFEGRVTTATFSKEENRVLFRIKYEDSDSEDIPWEELCEILQDQEPPGEASAQPSRSRRSGAATPAAAAKRESEDNEDEDENGGAGASRGQGSGVRRGANGALAPASARQRAGRGKGAQQHDEGGDHRENSGDEEGGGGMSAAERQRQRRPTRQLQKKTRSKGSVGHVDIVPDSEDDAPEQQQQQEVEEENRKEERDGVDDKGDHDQRRQRQRQQRQPERRQQRGDDDDDNGGGGSSEDVLDKEEEEGSPGRRAPLQPRRRRQEEKEAGVEDAAALEAEMDEEARIQRLLVEQEGERRERSTVREKGLAGHVKRVKLVNFMCHENFELDLSSHVNFICGSNGSGKSAVLQALQICLGATARETGRGKNLRELIRSGHDEAKLSVTLWNTGDDAYQRDRLGDWVTVERQVSKAGGANATGVSSSWTVSCEKQGKLKGATWKTLVEPMLDHLNIAAENPLCVMTQDKAREFLCNANDSHKLLYKLFMDATLMGEFKEKLDRTKGMVAQMGDKVTEIDEAFRSKEKELRALTARLQKLRRSEGLLEQREMLELASVWSLVRERQQAVDGIDASLAERTSAHKQELQAAIADLERQLQELQQEQQQLTEQQQQQNSVADDAVRGLGELKKALKAAQKDVQQHTRSQQVALDKFQETQEEMQQMKESMAQATQETGGDKRMQLLREMEGRQAEMEGLRRERDRLQALIDQAQGTKKAEHDKQEAWEKQVQQISARVRGLQASVQSVGQELTNMRAAEGNKLVMFGGPQMVHLCGLVQRHRGEFEREPIGPLGASLSLTDSRWKTAAECVMGAQFEKWVVHSSRDEQTLRRLASQAGLSGRLVVMTKDFDRPAYKVPREIAEAVRAPYIILRDLVVIEHPFGYVIDKMLMDNCHYQKVVVAETNALARDVVYERRLGPLIQSAVAVDGYKCQRSGPGGSVSAVPYRGSGRPPRLGGDVASGVREAEEELKRQQAQLSELSRQSTSLQAQVIASKAAQKQAHEDHRRYQAEANRLDSRIHDINMQTQAQALLPEEEEEGEEGDEMSDKVRHLEAQVAATQAELDLSNAELADARQKEARASQAYEDSKAHAELVREEIARATDELARVSDNMQDKATQLEARKRDLGNLDAHIAKAEAMRAQLAADVQQKRQQALQQCSEEEGAEAIEAAKKLVTGRWRAKLEKQYKSMPEEQRRERIEKELQEVIEGITTEMITGMLNAIEKAIQAAKNDAGGTIEELQAQEARLSASVQADLRLVSNVREVYNRTSKALMRREEGYQKLFDSVQKHVSSRFMNYMVRRKHEGKLRIDQDKHELKILVKMNNSGKENEGGGKKKDAANRAVQDLKQLSGGERSYTTVAFMLALGEYVEAPFRCMDEYDVFMDAINRRVATETLLGFALEREVQHMFLTPQDVTAIHDAKEHLEKSKKGFKLADGFVNVKQMRPARPAGRA